MSIERKQGARILAGVVAATVVAACGPARAPADKLAGARAALAAADNSTASSASAPTSISTPGTTALGNDARNRMNDVKGYMATLGLTSIEQQGTINLDHASLSSGIHVLRATCAQPVAGFSAVCTSIGGTLPGTSNTQPAAGTAAPSSASRLAGGAGAAAQTSPSSTSTTSGTDTQDGHVTVYSGDSVSDVAVVLADTVVFDGATVTLGDGVSELWIVARTIESHDSLITWQHANTYPDRIPDVACAGRGTNYDPLNVGTASAFDSPDGGDGDPTCGKEDDPSCGGHRGNPGLDAPDVYIYVDHFTDDGTGHVSLPEIQVQGQAGGDGQRGQCGGDGGNGAKGSAAIAEFFCTQGPGWGGDGGDGSDGGRGGKGGKGGDAGHIYINYVDLAHLGKRVTHNTNAGPGGEGGLHGLAGHHGKGGEEGDPKWPFCAAEPDRAGHDGHDGQPGADGAQGIDGASGGDPDWEAISAEDWEAAFTAPYIETVSPTLAYVGSEISFTTLNLTGAASVHVTDEAGHVVGDFPAVQRWDDSAYHWDDTSGVPAGRYIVSLTRLHDGRSTNTYRVALNVHIDALQFADEYDAVAGGKASFLGMGFPTGATVMFDGVDIGPGVLYATVDPYGRQLLSFTIPIRPTRGDRFVGDDGSTLHNVHLRQPYPLGDSAEVFIKLKREAGLTFRPSVNGYWFTNKTLTRVAKVDANAQPWDNFRETYGGLEVDLYTAKVAPLAAASYGFWRAFWSPSLPSALCTGISSSVLADYFQGVTGVHGYQTGDVAHTVMVRQGHILSREILSALIGQSVVGASFDTSATVTKVVDFMNVGTDGDGGSAPALIMIPNAATYLDAITTALTSFKPAAVADALASVVTAIGNSHSLVPFNVVYANPTDALPSRIYFYDSNHPDVDNAYMTIGAGGTTFNYDMFNTDPTSPYLYSTASGWTLGHGTVDFLNGDVSLPLSPIP